MKQRKSSSLLRLDYTTALVVSTASILVFAVSLLIYGAVEKHIRTTSDHTRPLKITNLTYCNGEKLDLTVPQTKEPAPLVIYMHGGGWKYGSKVTDGPDLLGPLVSNGFAAASINYRLSGTAKFPAAVQDVLCSVRFMRAHHEQFNIDPENIVLIGYSSGGNLAALAGLGADEPSFGGSQYSEQNNRVQAVVTLAAHLNLGAANFTDATESYLASWLGSSGDRERANPIRYIDESDPPVMVVHSLNDAAVPYSQAREFMATADKYGLSTKLISVENGGHNFQNWLGRDSPDSNARTKAIIQFLASHLSN